MGAPAISNVLAWVRDEATEAGFGDMAKRLARVFLVYGTLLTEVPSFKLLGRTLSSSNDNWPEVEQIPWQAWVVTKRAASILEREGADRRTVGRF